MAFTQNNILWTGREYHSLENCLVTRYDNNVEITSSVIGVYEGKIYKLDYSIRTNEHWETLFFELKYRHSNQEQTIKFEGDGKGHWLNEGKRMNGFDGCIDIDIPLTPFTNTLPVNRLKLTPAETKEIQVIYLDVLEQRVRPVRQKYTCISAAEFHYENVPNDFEAIIRVDELGLVVDYPSLFVRTAILQTNYR
jgi:uncharacterized protein